LQMGAGKVNHWPMAYHLGSHNRKRQINHGDTLCLGFIGRLDWPPNRLGLEWFLRSIAPNVLGKNIFLKIAGSGNGSWLKNYSQEYVKFIGRVESPDAFYEGVDCVINPIQSGAGVKIKILEAIAYGIPILTCPASLVGSGFDPEDFLLVSDSPSTWTQAIRKINLTAANEQAEKTFLKAQKILSPQAIGSEIIKNLKELV